jgi:hypothetical protein
VKDPKKILAIALALVAFVLFPLKIAKGKRDDTQKKTAAVQAQVADADTALKSARKAKAAVPDNQKKLQELSVRMPPKSDEQGFILQLEQLAGASNVEWMSSSFVLDDGAGGSASATTTTTVAATKGSTAAKPAQYGDRVSSSFVVNIELRGPFSGQMAYLQNLRSIDRLFTIDKLELAPEATQPAAAPGASGPTTPTTAPAAASSTAPVHANITLRVYTWSGPGATVVSAASASTTVTTVAGAPASTPVTTGAASPTTVPPTTVKG